MHISKVIVWVRSDGGLSICSPCISKDDPTNMSEEQALLRALQKDVPEEAENVRILNRSDLPEDLYFRNAWELTSQGITISKQKALDIHVNRIRYARGKELEKLDKAWMRASGQKNTQEADAIEAKRQYLRDLPQTLNINDFSSVEEIKAFWPQDLPVITD